MRTDTVFANTRRSNWVRLRTLTILRWIAILGQLAAITAADRLLQMQLELGWMYLAVGAAVASNLLAVFIYPENKRLSEGELVGLLIFDMTQLSTLLALSGGLNNPFALLILPQVTISATALRLQSTLLISAIAIGLISLVGLFHMPLRTSNADIVVLPDLVVFGFWAALVIGIAFQAFYARRVTDEVTAMSDALTATQMALAREQKLTDLGGVVAATAHELGTPLATIALVSQEMADDVDPATDLYEDARLIRDQAERCRVILRSMGRIGKDDVHLRRAPIVSVVEEAAEPHQDRGKTISYDLLPGGNLELRQPVVFRRPEIIHGLRNLVQNAVDFAKETVWISIRWSDDEISVRIADDGPGFAPDILPRLGDPFIGQRKLPGVEVRRPDYEGMGLGLFIAKTLLERSEAEVSFANGNGYSRSGLSAPVAALGAVVDVVWARSSLINEGEEYRPPLGENPPIDA